MPTPVVNVSIVRKRWTGGDWLTESLTAVFMVLIGAAIVSYGAAHVGALPDLGYGESAWVVLIARTLFAGGNTYRQWTKEDAK